MEKRVLVCAVLCLALHLPFVQSQLQTQCPTGCICSGTAVRCIYQTLRAVPTVSPNTTFLDLGGNQITTLDAGAFAGLRNLHTLILSSNRIQFISSFAFTDLTNLKSLYFQANQIEEVQPYTFRDLRSLRILYLHDNEISQLQQHSFYGLESLRILSLYNNELQQLPEEAMMPMTALTRLNVDGNRVQCDCGVAWLQNFEPLESPLTCAGPGSLRGRVLDDVTLADLHCVPPTVTAVETGFRVYQGEPAQLICTATGDPPPHIKWYFRGQQLMDSVHYRVFANGTLAIVSMVGGLEGEYTCVATNVAGNSSAAITVEYEGPRLPMLIRRPSNTHAFFGETFMLQCTANQYTTEYYWVKDGVRLQPSPLVVVDVGVGVRVLDAQRNDSGVYTCVAGNEEGEVRASAIVNVTGPLLTCSGVIDEDTIDAVRERINFAFNATQRELMSAARSPSVLLRRLRFPHNGSLEYLKAVEVFEEAVEIVRNGTVGSGIMPGVVVPELTSCELAVLGDLSGCTGHQRIANCSDMCYHQRYRSFDGSCNNLDRPLQGAADTPFVRLLEPAYEDGLGLPVGWSGGKPSARLISRSMIRAPEVRPDEDFTHMLMQVGQFLDHDLDLAPSSGSDVIFSNGRSCETTCDNEAPCFPIPVPPGDRRIQRECMPFTRSSAVCGTGAASLLMGTAAFRREQLNALSSYMDASQVYSPDSYTAHRLRDPSGGGRLLQGLRSSDKNFFLPFDNHSLIECNTGVHSNRSQCFLAGDVRANEQVGLTSMHTLFFREHNRIAAALAELNPSWDSERLYQESRRILIAEWQNIIFTEYLPKILGPTGLLMLGEYKGYKLSTDATIANAFATAAYRFGHSQIMPLFPRLDSDYNPLPVGPLRLQDAFFAPFRILEEGGVDPLIRGLIASPVKLRTSSQGLNSNLTEALFKQANEVALDLGALNIQRGRDHGLPGYNQWRQYCGLSQARTIEDLRGEINNASVRQHLREVYGDNPEAIDLWVGGLLEDVVSGSQLGPTFLCIIADQFRRLREGDRHWFERDGQFSPDQLLQLRQASLSRIICDNADNISTVPRDALILQPTAQFVSCDSLPSVELSLWKECGATCEPEGRRRRSLLLESARELYSQQLLDELRERVGQLEEKASHCKFNQSLYRDGETWNLDNCTQCSCKTGEVICSRELCTTHT